MNAAPLAGDRCGVDTAESLKEIIAPFPSGTGWE